MVYGLNTPTAAHDKNLHKRGREFSRLFLFGLLKICTKMEDKNMSVHTFKIRLANGEKFTRSEWGRTRKSALRTIWGIYGRENVTVLA